MSGVLAFYWRVFNTCVDMSEMVSLKIIVVQLVSKIVSTDDWFVYCIFVTSSSLRHGPYSEKLVLIPLKLKNTF